MIILFTNPSRLSGECELINSFFESGLDVLHIRRPEMPEEDFINLLNCIDSRFHHRIVIHDFYHLINNYSLKGIHKKYHELYSDENIQPVSTSCHSFEEIKNLSVNPEYVFLSPVFNSISKKGYSSAFTNNELIEFFNEYSGSKIIALGGINNTNIATAYNTGFNGVAVLGYIWDEFSADSDHNAALKRFGELIEYVR